MKWLQLASERLLATGDNTAAEAWASRCGLFLYEDVANGGCKYRFLEQQIKVANSIHPNLGRLLELGGKRKPVNEEEMSEVTQILQDEQLSDQTLRFCKKIVEEYSFEPVLIGALKRTAWHHAVPSLMQVEADTMDEKFKSGLIEYLKSFDAPPRVLQVKNLPLLAKRVHQVATEHLEKHR